MTRQLLSLSLVCCVALAAHANISTDFSSGVVGAKSFTAVDLGDPTFSAIFGAGFDGLDVDAPGSIVGIPTPGGNGPDTAEFYGPGGANVFGFSTAPLSDGIPAPAIYFQNVTAKGIEISGYVSDADNGVDIYQTRKTYTGELTITALNQSGNEIAGSAQTFSGGDFTYSYTNLTAGIRSISLLLHGDLTPNTNQKFTAATLTSASFTATPEPSSMALLGLAGLSGAAVRRYRRKRAATAA